MTTEVATVVAPTVVAPTVVAPIVVAPTAKTPTHPASANIIGKPDFNGNAATSHPASTKKTHVETDKKVDPGVRNSEPAKPHSDHPAQTNNLGVSQPPTKDLKPHDKNSNSLKNEKATPKKEMAATEKKKELPPQESKKELPPAIPKITKPKEKEVPSKKSKKELPPPKTTKPISNPRDQKNSSLPSKKAAQEVPPSNGRKKDLRSLTPRETKPVLPSNSRKNDPRPRTQNQPPISKVTKTMPPKKDSKTRSNWQGPYQNQNRQMNSNPVTQNRSNWQGTNESRLDNPTNTVHKHVHTQDMPHPPSNSYTRDAPPPPNQKTQKQTSITGPDSDFLSNRLTDMSSASVFQPPVVPIAKAQTVYNKAKPVLNEYKQEAPPQISKTFVESYQAKKKNLEAQINSVRNQIKTNSECARIYPSPESLPPPRTSCNLDPNFKGDLPAPGNY